MKTDYIRKIVRASIPTLSGYLLFFYAMKTLDKPVEIQNMLLLFFGALIFTAFIYLLYTGFYFLRRNRIYNKIVSQQTIRVMNSRNYFNNMGEYFRRNWVLAFNECMKEKTEVKRRLLLMQKKELFFPRSLRLDETLLYRGTGE